MNDEKRMEKYKIEHKSNFNFDDYAVKQKYPKVPKVPSQPYGLNHKEWLNYAEKVKDYVDDRKEYIKKLHKWQREDIRLKEKFKNDALRTCGAVILPSATQDEIWSMSINSSISDHRRDYHEIYIYMEKYTDFAIYCSGCIDKKYFNQG